MNYFAKNIYFLRKLRGITQAEIPDYVSVNRATWSNYELKRTEPSIQQLVEISTFFGVSLDDLILKDLETNHEVIEKVKTQQNVEVNPEPNSEVTGKKSKLYEKNGAISLAAEDAPGGPTISDLAKQLADLNREVAKLKAKKGK